MSKLKSSLHDRKCNESPITAKTIDSNNTAKVVVTPEATVISEVNAI